MSVQPTIQNDVGAILTVGCTVNGERVAIVEPYGIDDNVADPSSICNDLVQSWGFQAMPVFLLACSHDLAINYISAEGMRDGRIPYRVDFASTAHVGGISTAALPTSVCGLIAYYQDPADVIAGHRLGVAKTFMPGLAEANVVGQNVSGAQQTLYQNYANAVFNGFTSSGEPTHFWWRVLSSPKPRSVSAACKRIAIATARGYVATQKRRLVPR